MECEFHDESFRGVQFSIFGRILVAWLLKLQAKNIRRRFGYEARKITLAGSSLLG